MDKKPHIIKFNSIESSFLGNINIAEYKNHVPFVINRVYWTDNTPYLAIRGHHAHISLEQCIFAVGGEIEVELVDMQERKIFFNLNKPNEGLYIPPMYWRRIRFSNKAIMVCLASEVYKEDDYIRDYSEFIKLNNSNDLN